MGSTVLSRLSYYLNFKDPSQDLYEMFSVFSKQGLKAGFGRRLQSTLVLIEHDGQKVNPVSRHALTAAKKVGGEVSCLVAGTGDVAGVASEVAAINGLAKVLVVSSDDYKGNMPERL